MAQERDSSWLHWRFAAPVIGAFLFALATLSGCNQPVASPERERPSRPPLGATDPTAETIPLAVDVPTLLPKSVDEIRTVLGPPADSEPEPSAQQVQLGVDEWSNSFTKDGQEVLVTFNPATRQVVDIFLAGEDEAELMQKGNLSASASGYRLEPVKQLRDPSKITGIKIIPTG